jgi:hypothetical protein
MSRFASGIANHEAIGQHETRARQTVPIADAAVVFGRFVFAAVFETDQRAFTKRHEVGKQKRYAE